MMASSLEKSILSAIVFFDVFDYPLTPVEARKFVLDFSCSRRFGNLTLSQVKDAIAGSEFLRKAVREKNGFFYLRGRDGIVKTRHRRYAVAAGKFTAARMVSKIFSRVPFVSAVFLTNTLSYNNTKKDSDIDLVIITKKGGVWLARMFALIFLTLARRRPGHCSGKDKICLSVFADEEHLDFYKYKMSDKDMDFLYWLCGFYPLYDSGGIYKEFWKKNSPYIKEYLPSVHRISPNPKFVVNYTPRIRLLFEAVSRPFSHFARCAQKAIFPEEIRDKSNKDTRVRVEEGFLKLHTNDRRLEHLSMFVKKYEKITSF